MGNPNKRRMIDAEELLTWIYTNRSRPDDPMVTEPICERIRLMAYSSANNPTNFRNPGWESRATENGETVTQPDGDSFGGLFNL